jgi:hypothetical protein
VEKRATATVSFLLVLLLADNNGRLLALKQRARLPVDDASSVNREFVRFINTYSKIKIFKNLMRQSL